MYTRQSAFDKVVLHLRKQGRRATDNLGSCLYRGENGDMCAIGCLIPDSEYKENLEGKTANSDHICQLPSIHDLCGDGGAFLFYLQCVHDQWYPESREYNSDGTPKPHQYNSDGTPKPYLYSLATLESRIRDFAEKYHLTIPQ